MCFSSIIRDITLMKFPGLLKSSQSTKNISTDWFLSSMAIHLEMAMFFSREKKKSSGLLILSSSFSATQCGKFRFYFASKWMKFSIIVHLKRNPSFIEHDRAGGKGQKSLWWEARKKFSAFPKGCPDNGKENEKSLAELEKYQVFEAMPEEAEI